MGERVKPVMAVGTAATSHAPMLGGLGRVLPSLSVAGAPVEVPLPIQGEPV